MNKYLKTNQSGRSMVEMLGVLAIIGVLSVGGIAGYTTSMNKHKANEIMNDVSIMYMLGMSAEQGKGSSSDMTYSATVGTVPSGATEITYKADKTVVVGIKTDSVCDQVKNQLGDKVTAGDCETATDNVYSLTITMGDTTGDDNESSPTIDCSEATVIWTDDPSSGSSVPSCSIDGCFVISGPATDLCVATKAEASELCKTRLASNMICPGTLNCYDGNCSCADCDFP